MASLIANVTQYVAFGSFSSLCQYTGIPGCLLFTMQQKTSLFYNATSQSLEAASYVPSYVIIPDSSTNATSVMWYSPPFNCQMVTISNTEIRDLGNLVMCICIIALTLYLATRVRRKPLAVGWKEFNVFLISYTIMLLFQIISVSLVSPMHSSVSSIQAVASLNIAMIVATAAAMAYFGFTGYQYLPDGSKKSIIAQLVCSISLGVVALGICLGTAYQKPPLNTWTASDLYSPALAGIYFILPGLLICIFLGAFVTLLVSELGIGKPVFFLIGGSIIFAVGQVLQMIISTPLCNASGGALDGTFFQTFLTFSAVACIYKCWDLITEDEPDVALATDLNSRSLSSNDLAKKDI